MVVCHSGGRKHTALFAFANVFRGDLRLLTRVLQPLAQLFCCKVCFAQNTLFKACFHTVLSHQKAIKGVNTFEYFHKSSLLTIILVGAKHSQTDGHFSG